MDKIILNGMQFYGYHGVLPEENRLGQDFIVDLELEVDSRKAGNSDNPADTANYAEIFRVTRAIVEGKACNLIETVAENIASALLRQFTVYNVKVIVKKPAAPVPGFFNYMAVEVNRRAGESESSE